MSPRGPSPRLAAAGLACLLALAAAQAQVHQASRGDFVLRSSTVRSEDIDSGTARRHGIERAPNRAVLNVLVLAGDASGPGATVRADVRAAVRNLAGMRQEIALREVEEGGGVSYLGTYEYLPRETLDFEIRATPLQPREQPAPHLTLAYRERMPEAR